MYYYKHDDKIYFSNDSFPQLQEISEEDAENEGQLLYAIKLKDPRFSRSSFIPSHSCQLFNPEENINSINIHGKNVEELPEFILKKLKERKVIELNASLPLGNNLDFVKSKSRVSLVGLGDVGGTLLTGLRLLGGDTIESIGIFDLDDKKAQRWEFEASQIVFPDSSKTCPFIKILKREEIFDCDVFIFCVSVGVPQLNTKAEDVRLVQFEGNSKIVGSFAKEAREKGFKGLFAVVSDPVDQLCTHAFLESNKNADGQLDFKGMLSEQIQGFGLGVMNARARYFASKDLRFSKYLSQGRAFGPHGEGLIIADSITDYNDELSQELTLKTKTANLALRNIGYKPYIAPALSSGSLTILAAIRGEWHYSSVFLGGIYMGLRNRFINGSIETEVYELHEKLYERLNTSYKNLRSFFNYE